MELDNKQIIMLPAFHDIPKEYQKKEDLARLNQCSYDNVFVKKVEYESVAIGCEHESSAVRCDCQGPIIIEYELWQKTDRESNVWVRMGTITNQWDTNPLEQFEIDKTE